VEQAALQVERLADARLRAKLIGRGRTLGGCRLVARDRSILVCREIAGTEDPIEPRPGGHVSWDRRAVIAVPKGLPSGITLGPLGSTREGLPAALRQELKRVPEPARASLPVLRNSRGKVVAVPAIAWVATGYRTEFTEGSVRFRPQRPNAPLGFEVPMRGTLRATVRS